MTQGKQCSKRYYYDTRVRHDVITRYPNKTRICAAVSPGGPPVTLVQLKYLLVTPLVSQCIDSIFVYLRVSSDYATVTLALLGYLILVQLIH